MWSQRCQKCNTLPPHRVQMDFNTRRCAPAPGTAGFDRAECKERNSTSDCGVCRIAMLTLSKLFSTLSLRYCKRKCLRQELFLQSGSLATRSAHTRRRGQRSVVNVGYMVASLWSTGVGRLFQKNAIHMQGVSKTTQRFNITEASQASFLTKEIFSDSAY